MCVSVCVLFQHCVHMRWLCSVLVLGTSSLWCSCSYESKFFLLNKYEWFSGRMLIGHNLIESTNGLFKCSHVQNVNKSVHICCCHFIWIFNFKTRFKSFDWFQLEYFRKYCMFTLNVGRAIRSQCGCYSEHWNKNKWKRNFSTRKIFFLVRFVCLVFGGRSSAVLHVDINVYL